MTISTLLEKLMRRENLTMDESAAAMSAIMSGTASPAQIGALLVGLTMKGERPAELAGLARTMRANAVQLSKRFDDAFDTCGTGGDRSGTFNIHPRQLSLPRRPGSAWRNMATAPSPANADQRGCVRSARREHRGGTCFG